MRGRRSGEAAEGTHKRSLWAVPLDGIVRHQLRSEPRYPQLFAMPLCMPQIILGLLIEPTLCAGTERDR